MASSRLARILKGLRPEPVRQRTVFRLLLMMVMIFTSVAGWRFSREWERRQQIAGLDALRVTLEARWSELNLNLLWPARTLCDELEGHQIGTVQQFLRRAGELRRSHDIYQGIYWVATDGTLKTGVVAEDDALESALPFGADAGVWKQLQHASSPARPVVGPIYESSYGRSLVLLYFPLGDDGRDGAVAVVLQMSRLMEQFADSDLRDLVSLDVIRDDHGGVVIYRTGDYMAARDSEIRQVAHLRIMDQVWSCQMTPTVRFTRQYEGRISQSVLLAGIMGTLISGGSVLLAMKRRWQHTMLQKGQVQVIDVLGELTRSISSSRGESGESLLRIAETARPVTESDAIGIYQFTQDHRRLELICSSSSVPLKRTIELDRIIADTLRVVTDGRLIQCGREHPDSLHAMRLFDNNSLRSGMLAPLQLGRVIGVMVFGSTSGSTWPEGRVALVKLWASQTAALLGDEAIHAQMRDALAVQEKLARRREAMLNLLGEIYQAGTVEQTLGRIAQLSPHSLGVEACVVAQRTRGEGELEIVAATGELGVRYFGVRLTPSGEQLVRLFKPDSVALIEPGEMEQAGFGRIAEPWLAGLAAIPMLHSDGRPIGCLVLMSANQQAFTADQLDLARVLASRASAAIENAQLNQQIRRDAETRMMLLRELNHRVKNNLAGIVGLLSMSSTMEMPDNVRQWLDRVIERIGNIARAHELFSGGMQTVSLAELVEQVIPSLAVVKPPRVVICKDLGPAAILLKTTQAVSLAMVIHELCYNAIVHGLGARGTLTIRAQIAEGRNAILEIIDDGTAGTVQPDEEGGLATMAPPVSSTGLGLRLVKGLVGRELRGRFTMRRRHEGGTVVSVEFPLDRDREEGDNPR